MIALTSEEAQQVPIGTQFQPTGQPICESSMTQTQSNQSRRR